MTQQKNPLENKALAIVQGLIFWKIFRLIHLTIMVQQIIFALCLPEQHWLLELLMYLSVTSYALFYMVVHHAVLECENAYGEVMYLLDRDREENWEPEVKAELAGQIECYIHDLQNLGFVQKLLTPLAYIVAPQLKE